MIESDVPIYTMKVKKGTTFKLETFYTDETGAPAPLTGYSGRGSVKASAMDATALATLTIDVNEATGQVDIICPAAETENIVTTGSSYLDVTELMYDVELFTALDADVKPYIQGPFLLFQSIT